MIGATATNFAYDAQGRLCAVGATTCTTPNVTYDSAGRTKSWNGWTFAYDADGRLVSACKSATCAAGFDKVTFAYDGEGHRTQIQTTSAAGVQATTDFRYQGDAIVEEKLTDAAHPSPGTVIRQYVVDDAGSIVKMAIPAGEPNAGDYLVSWNGHGDALNLLRVNADGTTTLANSFSYTTWAPPPPRPTTAIRTSASGSSTRRGGRAVGQRLRPRLAVYARPPLRAGPGTVPAAGSYPS